MPCLLPVPLSGPATAHASSYSMKISTSQSNFQTRSLNVRMSGPGQPYIKAFNSDSTGAGIGMRQCHCREALLAGSSAVRLHARARHLGGAAASRMPCARLRRKIGPGCASPLCTASPASPGGGPAAADASESADPTGGTGRCKSGSTCILIFCSFYFARPRTVLSTFGNHPRWNASSVEHSLSRQTNQSVVQTLHEKTF